MKKLIFNMAMLSLGLVAFISCDNTSDFVYKEKDAVYFNVTDNLYYSFIGNLENTSTIEIPINVMGDASTVDRTFKAIVDQENTTAQVGLHYKALDESYTFGADLFTDNLSIEVYKTDPALETEDRVITLQLVASDDFDLGYSDKLQLKVYITNQIIKPSYWDGYFDTWFGEYSKIKHNIAISIMGHDFPYLRTEAESTEAGYGSGYWQVQGRLTSQYFRDNIVYEEDGVTRIFPWSV